MRGFLILIAFQLAGIEIHKLGVPLPGAVLGLLLFLAALTLGMIRLEWVERAADFLVRHMLLLFVPLLAGLTVMGPVLRKNALPLIASTILSLIAVLLTTGGLGHLMLRNEDLEEEEDPVD